MTDHEIQQGHSLRHVVNKTEIVRNGSTANKTSNFNGDETLCDVPQSRAVRAAYRMSADEMCFYRVHEACSVWPDIRAVISINRSVK